MMAPAKAGRCCMRTHRAASGGIPCARGSGAAAAAASPARRPARASLALEAASPRRSVGCLAAKGTYNTDYSATDEFKRHDKDVGSSEYQISRIHTRILQLTEHLKDNRTDHSTRRGLLNLLGQRNKLLKYLYRTDRKKFNSTVQALNIRSKIGQN